MLRGLEIQNETDCEPCGCKRPEYIAHRDFTPIECLPDDCLLVDYPVDVPWKHGMPASALVTSSEPIDATRKAA